MNTFIDVGIRISTEVTCGPCTLGNHAPLRLLEVQNMPNAETTCIEGFDSHSTGQRLSSLHHAMLFIIMQESLLL